MLAKNLYNASLFRIRQVFTGWDKESRSDNEKEIFAELEATKKKYPAFKARRVLKYNALENIMRANNNPDFFAGLPMQTAQAVVRAACTDFDNWLKALKAYKENPSAFLGKPRMPGYCKSDRRTFEVTNQDAVLYRDKKDPGTVVIKLPGISQKQNVRMYEVPEGTLKTVTVKPFYGKYILTLVMEREDCVSASAASPDLPNMAGLDFGTDNIIAMACTDGSSVVCKGGAILSENQLFAKKRASAVSLITAGHEHKHAASAHLDHLSLIHSCRTKDSMHKVSTFVIRWCLAHGVGTLVLGVNKLWKQNAGMSRQSNQKFVTIPHAQLRQMIEYKALIAGITVVEQEESYTSKADVTAADPIPVYGQETGKPVFSGRRIMRGLYRTKSGLVINADCNVSKAAVGAANILRKAFPDAWASTKDYRFLAMPESVGFHKLNRKFGAA